jgi:hypothetical protein
MIMEVTVKLKMILGGLGFSGREQEVKDEIVKMRNLYVTLPYQYPGDEFVCNYFKNGLLTGDTLDNVKNSFHKFLSMDQAVALACASMGLHYHKNKS